MNFTTRLPAFRKDNNKIQLSDILKNIDGEGLIWSFMDFEGVGTAATEIFKISMSQFEFLTKREERGFVISWEKLNLFSALIDQVINTRLIGTRKMESISRGDEESNEIHDFVIECLDSTEWRVHFNSSPAQLKFQETFSY